MQAFEVIDILEHGANHLVHDVIWLVSAGHKCRHHTKRGHVGVCCLVGALRYGGKSVKRILIDQFFFYFTVQVYDSCAASIGGYRYTRIRYTNCVTIGIDFLIAQRLGLLG